MESKLSRQQNAMKSLAKPKHTTLSEKKNTWSNLLNKKSASTNTKIAPKNKSKIVSAVAERDTKTMDKNVQCGSFNSKSCEHFNPLSVFNPIRTLQFLLKEIKEFPNVQNTNIAKITDEMQLVVEKIVDEFSEKVSNSKLYMPTESESSMIPTRENGYCKDLKFDKNPLENQYWVMLLRKVSELENNYSQLTKNVSKSEQKLLCMTSERDSLLEKFKESCDSLEIMNNREQEYLDTITELKSKLTASEKLISKQEIIIKNLNKKFNNFHNENDVKKIMHDNMLAEQLNVLKENNELKNTYSLTKLNMDKSEVNRNFKDHKNSKLRSDVKQIKQIVFAGIENTNIKSVSTASLKSENNLMKDFSSIKEDNKVVELDIDTQYSEYNKQVSGIKLVKAELQQLFEKLTTQTNISKKMLNSTMIESDISDEEDNHSSISNFKSIITDSSC